MSKPTYYYAPRDDWSFLEMILWARPSSGQKTTSRMREGSAKLLNKTPGQTEPDGAPAGFELPAATGISDHWPLVVSVEMTVKQ